MTTQEAIDLMKLMLSDNDEIYSIKEIEALEIVIKAAEKSIKYRKKAKRFKRKWLGLKCNLQEIRKEIAQLQNPIPANYFKGEYISRDTVLEIINDILED